MIFVVFGRDTGLPARDVVICSGTFCPFWTFLTMSERSNQRAGAGQTKRCHLEPKIPGPRERC